MSSDFFLFLDFDQSFSMVTILCGRCKRQTKKECQVLFGLQSSLDFINTSMFLFFSFLKANIHNLTNKITESNVFLFTCFYISNRFGFRVSNRSLDISTQHKLISISKWHKNSNKFIVFTSNGRANVVVSVWARCIQFSSTRIQFRNLK